MRRKRFGQVPLLTKQASTVTRAAKAGSCVEAADRLSAQVDNLSTDMTGKRVLSRTQAVVDNLCGRGFTKAIARNTRLRGLARAVEKPTARACVRTAIEVGSVLAVAPDAQAKADAEAIAAFVEKQCSAKVWPIAERVKRRKTLIGMRGSGARVIPDYMPGMKRRPGEHVTSDERALPHGRGRTAEDKASQMTDAAARALLARLRKSEVDLTDVSEPVLQRIATYARERAGREGGDVRRTAREVIAPATPWKRKSFRPIKRR